MRISDWSSDVCSSDLRGQANPPMPHVQLSFRGFGSHIANSRRRGCQPRARKSAMRRRERRFAPFPRARAAARRPGMTDIAITPEIVAEHGLTPDEYQVILSSLEIGRAHV